MLTPVRLPRVEPINIHEVMERVRTLVTAEFPGLEAKRDYDTSLPDITGDREQLIQAVLNVARNAAQAMAGKGEIRMSTRIARQVTIARMRYRHAIAVSVEDDGPGIPPRERERVWDRFYRAPGTTGDGCGLGLAIVREIAEVHGAVAAIESVPGGGTRVVVRMARPVAPAGAAPAPAPSPGSRRTPSREPFAAPPRLSSRRSGPGCRSGAVSSSPTAGCSIP